MQQKKQVVEHFERFAECNGWSKLYEYNIDPKNSHSFLIRKKRVEDLSDNVLQEETKVLDIGCGTGIMANYYLNKGCEYHGMDISKNMINQAKQKLNSKKAIFQLGDIEAGINYSDEYFDLVIALGLIEYLDNVDRSLSEIVRVTKNNGNIIVTAPHSFCLNYISNLILSPFFANIFSILRRIMGKSITPYHIKHRRFTVKQLDNLFRTIGCKKTGHAYYNMEMFFYPFNRILPRIAHRIKKWSDNRNYPLFKIFATGCIIRVKKSN